MNTLNPISQALASQGRYGDSTLVHMNPQEVAGLQSLARNRGTTLTVNPQTGLPEAFNLGSFLPMIAGLALGPAGIGLTALQAGMLTGAATGLITKDPMQGLMAGLGGYGGAGLGAGFSAAGASAGAPGMTGNLAAQQNLMGNLGAGQSFYGSELASQLNPAQVAAGQATASFGAAPITGASPAFYGDLSQLTPGEMGAFASQPPLTLGENLSQAGRGFTSMLGSGPEGTAARSAFMGSPEVAANAAKGIDYSAATGVGGLPGLVKYGSAAAAPVMMAQDEPLQSRPSYLRDYDLDIENLSGMYDPLASSSEQDLLRYRFTPREPVRVAQGGPIRFQEGGDVGVADMGGAFVDPYTGASLTPAEADVFRNITNVERMGGIPITGLPGGAPHVDPAQMARFQGLVAGGDYSGAGTIAQQAGFSPFQVSQYVNENLSGLNLSEPVTPQTVASFFTPNMPLNKLRLTGQSTDMFELPPSPPPSVSGTTSPVVPLPTTPITPATPVTPTNPVTPATPVTPAPGPVPGPAPGPAPGPVPGPVPGPATPVTPDNPYGISPNQLGEFNSLFAQGKFDDAFNLIQRSGISIPENVLVDYIAENASGLGLPMFNKQDPAQMDVLRGRVAGYYNMNKAASGGLASMRGFKRFQEGGLASMMTPSESSRTSTNGRFLRGNGDGMSDEIPATIEGEQDALLSDGEFVIPADVVSHLGNGSSEAGAKVLYAMMDRVRKARTGNEEQSEEIDVTEFMPA